MFTWTAEKALALLDAGVLSIMNVYNMYYAKVVAQQGTEAIIGGRAHKVALDHLVSYLDILEEDINSDGYPGEDYEGPLYLDAWAIMMDAPQNLGIERMPVPMFFAIA